VTVDEVSEQRDGVDEASEARNSILMEVSNALVRLHKEQFGRGPTKSRSNFAGPDVLVCTLSEVLLPAERKLVEMDQLDRVVDSRTSFQHATAPEFVAAIEQIVHRKVIAFASGIVPGKDTVFETFLFEHQGADGDSA
jgi:uncharacterized protein YbcI